MATQVSQHFTLEELTTTQHRGLDNTPDPQATANLYLLAAEQLESIRSLWGCPLYVSSGFRSKAVNAAVGGSKTSQHCLGLAADIIPLGKLTLREAFEKLLASSIVFDQAIYERPGKSGGWIHVSRPGHGQRPRKQALMYVRAPDGSLSYAPWNPARVGLA